MVFMKGLFDVTGRPANLLERDVLVAEEAQHVQLREVHEGE